MQTKKFHRYTKQFGIAFLLHPRIGGPFQATSHLIPAGVDEDKFWQGVAQSIKYIAVRPDFDSLNLEDTSSWCLSQATEGLFRECEIEPAYNTSLCLVPQFTDDGHVYELIGAELSRIDRRTWSYSCWSATDTATSVKTLLGLIKGFLKENKLQYAMKWKLLYVLKISWKHTAPEFRSYEIFVPSPEWIEANAYFHR